MCKYRKDENLIVLTLYGVSINKIAVTEIMTVKVSQNLNLIQKYVHDEISNLSQHVFFKSNIILGNIKHSNE